MRYIFILLFSIAFSFSYSQETFTAYLTGNQEVLPVNTTGYGEMTAVLDGDSLRVEGWFDGLSSPYATEIAGGSHIHIERTGRNGDILFSLTPELDADSLGGTFDMEDNTFELTEQLKGFLRTNFFYFNIHTDRFTAGELRGQILHADAEHYYANMFGTGEVPSAMTGGSGAVWLTKKDTTITVSGSFNNLESDLATDIAGGAHLHIGSAGENGAVEIPLNASTPEDERNGIFDVVSNTFTISSELDEALPDRRVYINVHSEDNRIGELRGQLTPPALRVFRAHLSGTQEIPTATTRASGVVIAELKADTSLVVSGSFSGLESPVDTDIAGGGHLHNGLAGENAGVRFPLNLSINANDVSGAIEADSNRYELTPDDRADLTNRSFYVNIHSEKFQIGEIRGQLLPFSQMTLVAPLSGIFEIPRGNTFADGAVVLEVMGNQLTLSGSFAGLRDKFNEEIAGGAHIHTGYTGENGPVTFGLTTEVNSDSLSGHFHASENTYTLDSVQMQNIRERQMYVNVHSEEFPGGELRGPIAPEANMIFEASLGGGNEVPPFSSRGFGGALLEIRNGQGILSGSFSEMVGDFDSTIAGGAHIHGALPGENGPILMGLGSEAEGNAGVFPASQNIFEVSTGWIDSLRDWQYYVNVHTDSSASGELRGQLLPLAQAHYSATLQGINEVQPVPSPGGGALSVVANRDSFRLGGAFSSLNGDFDTLIAGGSHLHSEITGFNGSIVTPLSPQLGADLKSGRYLPSDNQYSLDSLAVLRFYAGAWYANIHTTEFPNGELRGQVLPEINMEPVPGEIIEPADGQTILIEGMADEEVTILWSDATDAEPNSYIWEAAIDSTFNTPIIQFNAANAPGISLTYGFIDTLLRDFGIPVGETALLYHRVRATDGSLIASSPGKLVNLTRGEVVATEDPLPEGYTFEVRPNLVREGDEITVQLSSAERQKGELVLFDSRGTPVQKRSLHTDQSATTERLNISSVSAGLYYLVWKTDGKIIGRRTISVVR